MKNKFILFLLAFFLLASATAGAQIRELTRTVSELSSTTEKSKQQSLMQKGGEIFSNLLGDDLHTTDTETSVSSEGVISESDASTVK